MYKRRYAKKEWVRMEGKEGWRETGEQDRNFFQGLNKSQLPSVGEGRSLGKWTNRVHFKCKSRGLEFDFVVTV